MRFSRGKNLNPAGQTRKKRFANVINLRKNISRLKFRNISYFPKRQSPTAIYEIIPETTVYNLPQEYPRVTRNNEIEQNCFKRVTKLLKLSNKSTLQ